MIHELRRIPLPETVWKLRKGSITGSHEPAEQDKRAPFGRFALPENARSDPRSEFPDSLSTHYGALREEDSVPLCSDRRIAALRGSAGLRYEAKPEFGARKPPRGTGRCECAAEGRRVLRPHRLSRAALVRRAGRFPLDQEADGCRHKEGARELEGVYDGHILRHYHCASPVPAHVEGTVGKLHGPEEPQRGDAAVVILNLRA